MKKNSTIFELGGIHECIYQISGNLLNIHDNLKEGGNVDKAKLMHVLQININKLDSISERIIETVEEDFGDEDEENKSSWIY